MVRAMRPAVLYEKEEEEVVVFDVGTIFKQTTKDRVAIVSYEWDGRVTDNFGRDPGH